MQASQNTILPGFVRLPVLPRAVWRGADLFNLTPRGRWLKAHSEARALANPAFTGIINSVTRAMCQGEIGSYSGFRFVISDNAPVCA